MSLALIRVSILGGALLLIAGCGGSTGSGSGSGGSGGGGNPTTVTFTITGPTPTAVATQIGTGAFTAATLSGGKLTLSLPSGTTNFAVAYVCPPVNFMTLPYDTQTYQYVFEASTLDGTSFSQACLVPPTISGTTGTLTGSVDASSVSGAGYLSVYAENGSSLATYGYLGNVGGDFDLSAPAGTDRVVVMAYSDVPIGDGDRLSLVAAKSFSAQAVPGALNGGNTVVLGVADEVTIEPLAYGNVPSGYGAPTTAVDYQMAGGGGLLLIANTATTDYPALPAEAVESGDYYYFGASAGNTSNPSEGVSVTMTSASAGPESFAFPPAWSYAGPTPAASPNFHLSYSGFSSQTGVLESVSICFPCIDTTNIAEVIATGNYLNGAATVVIPNLSGMTGFLSPPDSGTNVMWSAFISQGDFPSLQPLPASWTIKSVANSGTYTVP